MTKMNTAKECLLLIVAISTLPIMTGCLSTHVHYLGKSDIRFRPEFAYLDSEGNLYIKAELQRYKISNHFHTQHINEGPTKSLGSRFLILNAPGLSRHMEYHLQANATGTLSIVASKFQRASDFPSAELITGWYLYPDDLKTQHKEVILPPHLNHPRWIRFPAVPDKNMSITMVIGDAPVAIEIDVRQELWPSQSTIHRKPWAYPAVLVLAPFAGWLDVVICPVQLIWENFMQRRQKVLHHDS